MEILNILDIISTGKDGYEYIIKPFLEKRIKELREIFLSEIRQGNFSDINNDDAISICYRLTRDVAEGIAKNNLRLMARLICGLAEKKQLTAHNFQKYTKVLADLDQEEIEILAEIVKKYNSLPEKESNEYVVAKHRIIDSILFDKFGYPSNKNNEYSKLYVRLNMLERTGFVLKHGGGFSTHNDGIYGSPFTITPFFEQFIEFCPNWSDLANWCNYD